MKKYETETTGLLHYCRAIIRNEFRCCWRKEQEREDFSGKVRKNRSPVHPREVFADPLMDRASAIILAHNHPVGPLTPSDSDVETTRRLKEAGEVMGITVLDHLIFNLTDYFSFLENGIHF